MANWQLYAGYAAGGAYVGQHIYRTPVGRRFIHASARIGASVIGKTAAFSTKAAIKAVASKQTKTAIKMIGKATFKTSKFAGKTGSKGVLAGVKTGARVVADVSPHVGKFLSKANKATKFTKVAGFGLKTLGVVGVGITAFAATTQGIKDVKAAGNVSKTQKGIHFARGASAAILEDLTFGFAKTHLDKDYKEPSDTSFISRAKSLFGL